MQVVVKRPLKLTLIGNYLPHKGHINGNELDINQAQDASCGQTTLKTYFNWQLLTP